MHVHNEPPLATNATVLKNALSTTTNLASIWPVIAISYFCKPEEGAGWNFDRPKESHVLDRFELKCLFDGNDCGNYKNCKEQIWHFLTDDLIVDEDNVMPLIHGLIFMSLFFIRW